MLTELEALHESGACTRLESFQLNMQSCNPPSNWLDTLQHLTSLVTLTLRIAPGMAFSAVCGYLTCMPCLAKLDLTLARFSDVDLLSASSDFEKIGKSSVKHLVLKWNMKVLLPDCVISSLSTSLSTLVLDVMDNPIALLQPQATQAELQFVQVASPVSGNVCSPAPHQPWLTSFVSTI